MPLTHSRPRHALHTLLQITALILIWLAALELSTRWLHPIPPTVCGIAITLALLALGLFKREWLADGAGILLREMLVFFIPFIVAIVQYLEALSSHLMAILAITLISTLSVMLATGLAVDLTWRLQTRLHARCKGEK